MHLSPQASIVILTGAGISAESGIKTFRDEDGLWENHSIESIASPEGFAADPENVQAFYNARRSQLKKVDPNAAHRALARLDRHWPGEFLLVTQNVDDLHDRAGSKRIVHMHGELKKVRCLSCGKINLWLRDVEKDSLCPDCHAKGSLRPHIVWFGEEPFGLEQVFEALPKCGLFVAIGTSGLVHPAASFVDFVNDFAYTLEINTEPSAISDRFFEQRYGKATKLVSKLVDQLLEGVTTPGA